MPVQACRKDNTGRFTSTKTLEERFEQYVEYTNTCWLWRGALNTKGYGTFTLSSKHMIMAHRFAYELWVNKIPKNLCVLHKCDTPICVNPEHLFLGTQRDNVMDMINKRRGIIGELNGSAKLTEKQVKEIKQLGRCGITQREIAIQFDISPTMVGQILRHKNWLCLEEK